MSTVVRTHSRLVLALAMVIGACLVLLFALPLFGDDPKDKDPDQTAMQGKWKLQWLEIDGSRRDPTDEEKEKRLVVEGDKMAFGDTKFSFVCNSKTDPKLFDVKLMESPEKERLFEGLYKLEKDALTLCVFLDDEGGRRRPTEFGTKEGSNLVLVAFARAE